MKKNKTVTNWLIDLITPTSTGRMEREIYVIHVLHYIAGKGEVFAVQISEYLESKGYPEFESTKLYIVLGNLESDGYVVAYRDNGATQWHLSEKGEELLDPFKLKVMG